MIEIKNIKFKGNEINEEQTKTVIKSIRELFRSMELKGEIYEKESK